MRHIDSHNYFVCISDYMHTSALPHYVSISFWFPGHICDIWYHRLPKSGIGISRRGLNKTFSNGSVLFCMILHSVLHMPRRRVPDFVNTLFILVGLPLNAPSSSLLSSRGSSLVKNIDFSVMPDHLDFIVNTSNAIRILNSDRHLGRKHPVTMDKWHILSLSFNSKNNSFVSVSHRHSSYPIPCNTFASY